MSLLDTLLPLPVGERILLSGDAGMCVKKFENWLTSNEIFYLFRLKANAGDIFNKLETWANQKCLNNPQGDYLDSVRISGSEIHERIL